MGEHDERRELGPLARLALEVAGGLLFYAGMVALQQLQDASSPLRLRVAEAAEEIREARDRFREERFRLEIDRLERMVNSDVR